MIAHIRNDFSTSNIDVNLLGEDIKVAELLPTLVRLLMVGINVKLFKERQKSWVSVRRRLMLKSPKI